MKLQISKLLAEMIEYDKGDAMRIQHLIKVHGFAGAIGRLENLDEDILFILETAAILHDIGIHLSEEKYGSADGKYQEQEGPAEAEKMMRKLSFYNETQIERVKYLIGHHHSYSSIDGLDYQILIESDFLVNLFESASNYETAQIVFNKYFKTDAGKKIFMNIFR